MFNKVLIANRGEIACRVIRTCRALGIRTVAVYSEADRNALHVESADEAYLIGPPPVAQSYLNIDAILEAARISGADTVHPGYGLLSENPRFALACAERGIAFIGPSAHVVTEMANKVRARTHALAVNFPGVPGTDHPVDGDIVEAARSVGFPLMVKASAGGGGIGMTLVHGEDELERAATRARSMAERAFGDPEIYLERYLPSARHIEVQVLGDEHGGRIHLWHRECSVQRRHQKVVEEAPAPGISSETSDAMTAAALRLAGALEYTGAGTVECLLDPSGAFYFLEVNTRLQVEHPVTEMITGIDIVEQQLRIASGERLTLKSEEHPPVGHAIECRIYAEDPITQMPSPGTIAAMTWAEGEGVRVDSGYRAGDAITPYYDPLIAKLIVWGPDRPAATARLAAALDATTIEGTKTNLPLLREILAFPEFREGRYDTGVLDRLAKARATA
jgi:acetyl-CoA carboxylase biotin carboxylase subunit